MAKVIVTLPAAATTLGRDRTGAGTWTVAVAVAGARSRGYYQAVGRVQSRQEEGRRRGVAWALRDAHDTRLLRRISFLTSIVARDLTK